MLANATLSCYARELLHSYPTLEPADLMAQLFTFESRRRRRLVNIIGKERGRSLPDLFTVQLTFPVVRPTGRRPHVYIHSQNSSLLFSSAPADRRTRTAAGGRDAEADMIA